MTRLRALRFGGHARRSLGEGGRRKVRISPSRSLFASAEQGWKPTLLRAPRFAGPALRSFSAGGPIVLFFALLALTGCARELGYGGAHPGGISCKGKGTLTFMGGAIASAGLGGTEQNSGSVTADCGDGLTIIQGTPEQIAPTTTPIPGLRMHDSVSSSQSPGTAP